MYYRNSATIVLVYDITCLSSLTSLLEIITETRAVNVFCKFLLCGNKADLVDRFNRHNAATDTTRHVISAEGAVTYSQGLEFAKAIHCDGFVEVSAKTMRNIPELLTALGLLVLERDPPPAPENDNAPDSRNQKSN
ncbi:hypothetical protein Pelo_18673 [Pelomyxa schiedti]|nr:hypothetical protein Pelo_18673 [Pelomyxa schiedti]